MRRNTLRVAATAAIVSVLLISGLVTAGPASATGGSGKTLAEGLAGPLQIDVTHGGDVLVAQDFAGIISKVKRQGGVTDLVSEPASTPGVAEGPFGTVLYTTLGDDGSSALKLRTWSGHTKTIADLAAYETTKNPDAGSQYGFQSISPECAANWPADFGPPQYSGIVETHPYALASTPFGTFIADAAANVINFVWWTGHIQTVAVLPSQPLVLSADAVAGLGLDPCFVGLTYNFEAVPTDVEVHHGKLYVSTLPGGPEDPGLGARGSVYEINPWTKKTRQIATGFLGATNLAVSPYGTIYVAELFGNVITKISPGGHRSTVADLPSPAAVEYAFGRLYVTTDVFGSGKLITINA